LLSILHEKIHDNRFLRLIENLLRAGYLEEWQYHATLSGSPQGAVLSPILSNIYLSKLDQFVEHTLIPHYSRGNRRRIKPAWARLRDASKKLRREGCLTEARRVRRQMQALPSLDPHDPAYRRLRYGRYADDWLIGFSGPRHEAEAIKHAIGVFLMHQRRLTLIDIAGPYPPCGCGHGGTRYTSTSLRLHTRSVRPAAIAGVRCCHRLTAPVP
jgi:hypothetical protein